MQRRKLNYFYHVYYDQSDRAVCVERINPDDTIKLISGRRPTRLYTRMIVTDTFTLSDAIDQSLLTQAEVLNKSKGARYQRSPELQKEIELGVSHRALQAKYGISRATYYRLRSGLD